MTEATDHAPASGATRVKLVLAWTLVSVPLIWGVLNTLEKAALLFQ